MKKIAIILIPLLILSCNKSNKTSEKIITDSLKVIDSINAVRMQHNDSISIKNKKNVLKDLSGKHQLKFTSDEVPSFSGTVNFENIGRDLYTISGSAKSGKNTLVINGTIKKVTEKYLNFEGEVTQKINGTSFKRTRKTTFTDEKKGNFWRLQNKVNGAGFVEYIDIYF